MHIRNAVTGGREMTLRVNFAVLAVQADVDSAPNNDQIGDPLRRSKGGRVGM